MIRDPPLRTFQTFQIRAHAYEGIVGRQSMLCDVIPCRNTFYAVLTDRGSHENMTRKWGNPTRISLDQGLKIMLSLSHFTQH